MLSYIEIKELPRCLSLSLLILPLSSQYPHHCFSSRASVLLKCPIFDSSVAFHRRNNILSCQKEGITKHIELSVL